jgi:hypothetical protein
MNKKNHDGPHAWTWSERSYVSMKHRQIVWYVVCTRLFCRAHKITKVVEAPVDTAVSEPCS